MLAALEPPEQMTSSQSRRSKLLPAIRLAHGPVRELQIDGMNRGPLTPNVTLQGKFLPFYAYRQKNEVT